MRRIQFLRERKDSGPGDIVHEWIGRSTFESHDRKRRSSLSLSLPLVSVSAAFDVKEYSNSFSRRLIGLSFGATIRVIFTG